jgi:Holliday junction resolvase
MKPWEKQEKDLARRRGGARTPGSGSGWRRKNDVREGRSILWEAKQTAGLSISVRRVTWSELRKNAMMEGAMPALALRLGDVDLVVISQDDFDSAFPPTSADG